MEQNDPHAGLLRTSKTLIARYPTKSSPCTTSSSPSTSSSNSLNSDVCQSTGQDQYDFSDLVALGSVRVNTGDYADFWATRICPGTTPEVGVMIQKAINSGFIRTQYIRHRRLPNYASMRIYALAEDVGSHSRYGTPSVMRTVVKELMTFLDISEDAWNASYDPETPLQKYSESTAESDSLFYIFNTLDSPNPCLDAITDQYARQAVSDVLNNHIEGIATQLYPYQQRSAAMMIQREVAPRKSPDPRNRIFCDRAGFEFCCDMREGILRKHPHLYEEAKGGILAETMGYGKTLICLAVILATRGHFPHVPDDRLESVPNRRERVGSLLSMSAARAVDCAVPLKAEFHWRRKNGYYDDRIAEELRKHFHTYEEPIFRPLNPSRIGKRPWTKIVRLCSATLVIVPPNLLVQWQHEIKKHTEAGALDLLVLDHSTKQIPEYKELVKYDIVLITKARFEQEYRDNDLHTGRRGRGAEAFQSPLTDVRWLRVICDEGHGFAGSATRTNAVAMLDKMYIERRWIVSGTPSNTMLGVEVGLAANETSTTRSQDVSNALNARRASESMEQEIKDLEKLRLIVVKYLKVQPWANSRGSDHANWKKYIVPVTTFDRRQTGASLRTLLQSLVVRHRIEDIDVDLCLPSLHNRVVYLEPSYYDKLSINLFILVLTSNAITSERVDEDYMFHPKNRKQLDLLISNLRQSSFHWVGFKEHDVSEAVRVSRVYLDEHRDTISQEDHSLLMNAIQAGERALADAGWQAFSSLHEVGVYVENFPENAAQAWSIHGEAAEPLLLGTVQARQVQQHIADHSANVDPGEGLIGEGLRAMQSARRRAFAENDSPTKSTTNLSVVGEPKLKDQTSPTRVRSDTLTAPVKKRPATEKLHSLDSDSPLSKARILGFSSAKLAYLVDQVLLHQQSEKIIIFYDANNVAFWIAEALELLSIKFLIYANTLTVARRATYLATFNQNDDFRVLLMDLKQAAHGLHVACASRVYIVSPIWQPSIESQAIKRSHRISQTKPVFVETLVLRDTLEDRMLKRRKQMSSLELQRAERSLLDDSTMNQIIKNERFIQMSSGEESAAAQLARLTAPQPLFGSGHGEYGVTGAEAGLIMAEGDVAQVKKRKKVHKMVGISEDIVKQPTIIAS